VAVFQSALVTPVQVPVAIKQLPNAVVAAYTSGAAVAALSVLRCKFPAAAPER